MIEVDGPPEEWAGQIAQLMVDRDRDEHELRLFFETVFGPVFGP